MFCSYQPSSPTHPVVDELQSQFSSYDHSREQVEHILRHWDRAQGLLLVPVPGEDAPTVSEDATTEKQVIYVIYHELTLNQPVL